MMESMRRCLEFVQDYIRRGLPVEGGVTFDPHYWVILTGRPSRIIGITHKWLNEKVKPLMDKRVANLHYHTLYRSEGDYRKALEVKQELIDNFIDDRESEEKNKNSSRWPQHIQEIHVVDNDLEVINGLKLKRPPLTTHFMCLPTDRIEASS